MKLLRIVLSANPKAPMPLDPPISTNTLATTTQRTNSSTASSVRHRNASYRFAAAYNQPRSRDAKYGA